MINHYDSQILDLSKSREILRLLKSFFRDRPPALHSAPPWNLIVVLQALTKCPFEPIESISVKYLTLKTVFLITPASGRRRSEIHALSLDSVKFAIVDGREVMSVATNPQFLAKNQPATGPAHSGGTIIIPSLFTSTEISQSSHDCTLCL